MTNLGRIFLIALAALVAGCAGALDNEPYIWPVSYYGEPPRTSFTVRYSELRNDPEELREVIAAECGEEFFMARVVERPYRGTLLHPHEMNVRCGSPPPRPERPGAPPRESYLIQLRDLPTAGESPEIP